MTTPKVTKWTRYAKSETGKAPWLPFHDTPQNRAQAISQGAMFISEPALSAPYADNRPEPRRRGGMVLDFDCETLAPVLTDVTKLLGHLEMVYDIDPNDVDMYLSGKKGLHIIIPAILFGVPDHGEEFLPLIYKRFAAQWTVQLNLITLDMSMYCMRKGKMLRVANVQRRNEMYKVQIHFDELALDASELVELTKAPRLDFQRDKKPPFRPHGMLAEAYERLAAQVRLDMQERPETPTETQRELLSKEVPECIGAIIATRPAKSDKVNFNKLVMTLATYFRDAGHDEATALAAVQHFLEGYSDSATYSTPAKRLGHWRSMWAYLKDSPEYVFGCSYVRGLGLSGRAFECKQCCANPDRAKTREEFEKIIKQSDDIDFLMLDLNKQIEESGLPSPVIHRLRKLIARKTGTAIAELKRDAREGAAIVSDSVVHLHVARAAIESFGSENLITNTQFIYEWNGCGVWRKAHDRVFRERIHNSLQEEKTTKSTVDSVLDLLKTETFKRDHDFDADGDFINVKNGELHFSVNGFELRPHRRESYCTVQLPINYDPRSTAPLFVQAMSESFRDDPDRVEKIKVICEMLGYSLLRTCRFEKFVMLFGQGANGKSVLLAVIEALVGHELRAAVQPSQFDNRFQRAHLQGKLVNVVSELPEGHELDDGALKALISGETTTAEHKNKDPFEFRPFATIWIAGNHLPHSRDFSDALFRRAICLGFNRVFAPHEQDHHLKNKLLDELPGILNLALAGIAEVLERGTFTEPHSSLELKQLWRVQCDQVLQFVEDKCTIDKSYTTTFSAIYETYKTWADSVGIKKQVSMRAFTQRLCRVPGVLKGRSMDSRYFEGISTKL